jgi:hypothetical protein
MKTLELTQLELITGGDCDQAEGLLGSAVTIGWIFGPIVYTLAIASAATYWTSQCGPSDYN